MSSFTTLAKRYLDHCVPADQLHALQVASDVPVTLLPLRIETRFVRVRKDATRALLEAITVRSIESLAIDPRRSLGEIVRSLAMISAANAKDNGALLEARERLEKSVTAVREQLESVVVRSGPEVEALREAQRKIGYRVSYFPRKIDQYLAKHDAELAVANRWTVQRRLSLDGRLKALLAVLEAPDLAPSSSAKDLLARQQQLINAYELLNRTVYDAWNIHAPEYREIHEQRAKIEALTARVRARLAAHVGEHARILERAKRALAAAELGAYLHRYGDQVLEAAPEAVRDFQEIDAVVVETIAGNQDKRQLVRTWRAQLRQLAELTAPKQVREAQLAALANQLEAISTSARRIASGQRLRDRSPALDEKRVRTDLDAALLVADRLHAVGKLSVLDMLAAARTLDEHLTHIESYLARARPGPNALREQLLATKLLARLDAPQWAAKLLGQAASAPAPEADPKVLAETRKLLDLAIGVVQQLSTAPSEVGEGGLGVIKLPVELSIDKYPIDKYPTAPSAPIELPGPLPAPAYEHELWIRVYPEQVAVDQLERRLTPDEIQAGREYWTRSWDAFGDQNAILAAWRVLVARYGSARARWIVGLTRPSNRPRVADAELATSAMLRRNIDERTAIEASEISIRSPLFDPVPQRAPGEQVVPTTSVMPERLMFVLTPGYRSFDAEGCPIEHATYAPASFLGERIPTRLAVGLDPTEHVLNHAGEFVGNEAFRWMVEFPKAVELGMGLRVVLPGPIADPSRIDSGFLRIEVIGVREGATPSTEDARRDLERLFEAHRHCAPGFELLAQGTATNITTDDDSGVDLGDPGPEASFALEQVQYTPSARPIDQADGQQLAGVLGLSDRLFEHAAGAGGRDIATAIAMNTALWHGSFGQHLEDLFYVERRDLPAMLSQRALDHTREFFMTHVLGRGRAPVFRVGRQPYGVLPMTNLAQADWLTAPATARDQHRQTLHLLLQRIWHGHTFVTGNLHQTLRGVDWWTQRHARNVADPLPSGAPAEAAAERFVELLGLQAVSAELGHRYGVLVPFDASYQQFQAFITNLGLGTNVDWWEVLKAYDDLFAGPRGKVWNATSALLDGLFQRSANNDETGFFSLGHLSPLRSHAPLLERIGTHVAADLSSLLSTPPAQLIAAAASGTGPSTSVLYLLARKAMLQTHWDAAARIWAAQPLINDEVWGGSQNGAPSLRSYWSMLAPGERNLATLLVARTTFNGVTPAEIVGLAIDWDAVVRDRWLSFSPNHPKTVYNYALGGPLEARVLSLGLDQIDAAPYLMGAFVRARYREYPLPGSAGTVATKRHFVEHDCAALVDPALAAPGVPLHTKLFTLLSAPTTSSLEPHLDHLRQTRAALEHLRQQPAAALDLALREHLDICAWRVDAWISGMIHERLEQQRAANSRSLIGAYGWVENLRPGGTRVDASGRPVVATPDGRQPYPAIDPDNQGYLHAPSLAHALTGAVLRAANLGSRGDTATINLSSSRIRQALALLEGVRAGQELPELLGYLFERWLHETDPALNAWVLDLRHRFSLVADRLGNAAPPSVPREALAARNVVDGLALVRAWRGGAAFPFDLDPAGNISPAVVERVNQVLDRLDGALDAVGDLLLTEATYQATQGNYDRAAAALHVLGDAQPPIEPQVVHDAARSFGLEHRVGVCLHPASPAPGALGRALAEPTLDEWLTQVLGDLSLVRFAYVIDNPDGTSTSGDLGLDTLGLRAIELVYAAGQSGLEVDGQLARWATWTVLATQLSISPWIESLDEPDPPRPRVRVDLIDHPPHWPQGVVSVAEIMPLLRGSYRVVTHSRPLRGGDLVRSLDVEGLSGDAIAALDLVELDQRIASLRAAYVDLYDQLMVAPSSSSPADLVALAHFGLVEALPTDSAAFSNQAANYLNRLRHRVRPIIEQRLAACDAVMAELGVGVSDTRRAEILIRTARELLGKDFQLCPHFIAHTGVRLEQALTQPPSLPGPMAVERWLHGVALVRSGVLALEQVEMFAQLCGTNDALELSIAQLPHRPGSPWLGLEFDPLTTVLDNEMMSLVLHVPPSFSPSTRRCCGLLIDSWIEQIPHADEQQTGLSFHYNQPNAEAPQALLVACHSRPSTAAWSYAELLAVLQSTREMIRLRTHEPDHLHPTLDGWGRWDHEASFIGRMGIGDIVSPSFDELSADFGRNNGTSGSFSPSSGPGGPSGPSGPSGPTAPVDSTIAEITSASD